MKLGVFTLILLLLAPLNVLSEQQISEGDKALSRKDYKKAFEEFLREAISGDHEAQMKIGTMYSLGLGVGQDNAQAIAWLAKSANQGNARAQYNLAQIYYKNESASDRLNAYELYKQAAEQGYPNAQHQLAVIYEEGKIVDLNYEKAAFWYKKAAEQEVLFSQVSLGHLYREGRGVNQDYEKAVYWYRAAAMRRDINSQYNLGVAYFRGKGVEQNDMESYAWFYVAGRGGDEEAKIYVAHLEKKLGRHKLPEARKKASDLLDKLTK